MHCVGSGGTVLVDVGIMFTCEAGVVLLVDLVAKVQHYLPFAVYIPNS